MKEAKYRKANIEDLGNIITLRNEVKAEIENAEIDMWQDDYPNQELLRKDIIDGYARIILSDDEITGYMALIPTDIDYEGNFYQSHNLLSFSRIMTDPAYRKRGLAKFLISKAIEEAKCNDYEGMAITVDEVNNRAVNLYRSFGFVKVGNIDIPEARNTLDKYVLLF